MESRTAFITGITGQDGSYLAELLLSKGYEVYGLVRRLSKPNTTNVEHILKDIHLLEGDITDQSSLETAVRISQPDEVYNLASQSFVATSWRQPVLTTEVNATGALKLLEAIRQNKIDAKFYQASSSEMFGKVRKSPQTETTPFHPQSPYAISKAFAYWATVNYKESYGMFCVNGILFNHESPRRGIEFVTRKITDGVARIVNNLESKLILGNLNSMRDWGYAADYVKAMWLMLQQDEADDYVIATGKTHSVREFVDLAFKEVNLNYQDYVVIDPAFFRPVEVHALCGNSKKAREKLKWKPEVSFQELVSMMVQNDLQIYGER